MNEEYARIATLLYKAKLLKVYEEMNGDVTLVFESHLTGDIHLVKIRNTDGFVLEMMRSADVDEEAWEDA